MKRVLSGLAVAIAVVAAVAIGAGQASAQSLAAPVANPGGPYSGVIGTDIQFNAALSTGAGLSFQWNFGDGTAATGPVVTHSYAAAGVYPVTLTVVDAFGQVASASTTAAVIDAGVTSGACLTSIVDQGSGRVAFVPSPFGQTCAVTGTTLVPGATTACVMTAAGTVVCGTTTPGQIVNGTVINGAALPWWLYQNLFPFGVFTTP